MRTSRLLILATTLALSFLIDACGASGPARVPDPGSHPQSSPGPYPTVAVPDSLSMTLPQIDFDITGIDPDNQSGQSYTYKSLEMAHYAATLNPDPVPHPVVDPAPYKVLDNAIYLPTGLDWYSLGRLDLWLAPGAATAKTPLVVYIHGGGFSQGSKADLLSYAPNMLKDLLSANYSVASIDYRLTLGGQNPYPSQMWDCAWAIKALRAYIAQSGMNIDTSRIACTGPSAGAGLSYWLGYEPDLAGQALCSMKNPGVTDEMILARSITLGTQTIPCTTVVAQSTRLTSIAVTDAQSFYAMDWWDVTYFTDYAVPELVDLYGLGQLVNPDLLRIPDPNNPGKYLYLYSKIAVAFPGGSANYRVIMASERESSGLYLVNRQTAVPTLVIFPPGGHSDLTIHGTPPDGWKSPYAPPEFGPLENGNVIHNLRSGLIMKKRFQKLGMGGMIQVYKDVGPWP